MTSMTSWYPIEKLPFPNIPEYFPKVVRMFPRLIAVIDLCFFIISISSTEYKQIGCFRIHSGPLIPSLEHTDPVLDGNFTTRREKLVKCLNAARRKEHKTFALKNGGECLSSTDGHHDIITKYETSDECGGNRGIANVMSVFLIKGEVINYVYCQKSISFPESSLPLSSGGADTGNEDSGNEIGHK